MKIMILKGTVCDKLPVRKGQVISTTVKEGEYLISLGKAEKYEEHKAENSTTVESLEDRAINPKQMPKRTLKKKGK